MSTKKPIVFKSFRLFDFNIFDRDTDIIDYQIFPKNDYESTLDEDIKTVYKKEFCIQMFGINEQGQTCSISVNDFKPFFYVKIPDNWKKKHVDEFKRSIGEKYIKNVEKVQHKKLYGFSAGKEFSFIKISFDTTRNMSRIKQLWYESGDVKKFSYKNSLGTSELEIYESCIPPLLRYFHIQTISPSGWVKTNMTKSKKVDKPTTTCMFEITTSSNYIIPQPDKETMVPYNICSFDIEASSSHGDFPLPKKSYKRLASNIYELFKKHKPNKSMQKKLFEKAVMTAFGFQKFDDVDLVYPLHSPDKELIQSKIKNIIDLQIANSAVVEHIKEVQTIISSFGNFDDEEENEYIHASNKTNKSRGTTTVIDVLSNDDLTRQDVIDFVDTALTRNLPPLEGDKVTFIGSTFMKYGEITPHLNHCLVLGTCDSIPGVTVETCETEKDLLIKWAELIQNEDPDIIIGYNIFGFDYEFMYRRAQETYCVDEFLKLSRIKGEVCGKQKMDGDDDDVLRPKKIQTVIENTKVVLASGEYDLRYYKMPGRLQIDMYTYFRRDFNLSSYKLDDVAGEFISDDITSVETSFDESGEITYLYSKNLAGLHINDFIHIEICGFTTDYYQDGKKFQVLNIENQDDFKIITIRGHHMFPSKSLKWTMAKDDVTPQDIFRLTNGSSSDRAIVAKYCIQDCNLVHHLMNKIDVITGYVEMANICSVPISFLVFRGQGIKLTSYVAKKCREKNTLMPDLSKKGSNEGYEGAIVLPPKCSMYMDNPVACVDYSSLYPSSMISQNYSHDSKVWTKEYNLNGDLIRETGEIDEHGNYIYDNLDDYTYIDIEFDTFRYIRKSEKAKAEKTKTGTMKCRWAQLQNNEKSIMPSILEELLQARKATKKLMKKEKDPFMENILDKRQLGYKVTANSLYGQCGAKTSTFYEKDVAASTTATGRMMIMYAKGVIETIYGDSEYNTENHGKVATKAEYIYGDTDSVFFTFNLEDPVTKEKIRGKKALEITIEIAQEAADLCTQFLKPPMGLEYEKTLMPFILLSKKRYVGMLYETNPNKGKLKYMGLSLKRRDSCDYLKDTYGGILDILMKDNDIEKSIEFLNTCLDDLVKGNVSMDKLSITRALRSEYKNPNQIAHRVLADRIGIRDPGNKPKSGDRIKYVFINTDSPKALLGNRVETPQFILDNKLKIDYTYYITNQLMKPLQQLFGLALVPIWQHRKKNGAIKEYNKDIENMEKELSYDYENYMKKKEKYCSAKVKTILFDDVLNKINNDKNNMRSIKSFFC
jgi:DNA polymerase elongation subunit (family B)